MTAPAGELVNRFRRAAAIATAVQVFCKRQRIDVGEYIPTLSGREWQMFATLSGAKSDYVPSDDTRALTVEILRDRASKLCIDCGSRQASKEATPSGRDGSELCEGCWRQEFAGLGEVCE